MKIKSKNAAADMVAILIIITIMGTVALIVARGIGDSTLAASGRVQNHMYNSTDYTPGDYVESPEEGEETPVEPDIPETEDPAIPEPPVVPDTEEGDEFIVLTPEEEIKVVQSVVTKNDAEKELERDKNYNMRGFKPTRHELYQIVDYVNAFNGRVFLGMIPPQGIIRDIFVKYGVI